MTKLRRKLKDMAKKRAHKKTVQKRKLERALKEQNAKKLAAENGEEPVELEEPVPISDQKAANMLGDLVTAKIGSNNNGKKKKPLSRKQLKRKAKMVEKGTAVAGALEKKWTVKKIRVKQRAQVRNEDVGI